MATDPMAATDYKVAEVLRSIAGPIFAATWTANGQKSSLTVHASIAPRRRELQTNILNALRNIGIHRVNVRFHASSALLSPKSLEKLVAKFAGDRIVYDPTSSLTGAQALIAASHSVRASLGERVRGLFYAPRLRTFYVSLESARVVVGEKLRVAELANIEKAVVSAVASAFRGHESCPSVRVGFGLPATVLVPVDHASTAGRELGFVRAIKRYWKPVAVAAMFGLGGATAAKAGDPAVADPNFKASGQFGNVIDDYAWFAQGQFTAPLGEDFGLQIEGGGGELNGHQFYGVGGHLFTRDPDLYLLGLFGGYARAPDFDVEVARAGAEAEFYLSDLTILATAGYQFSDSAVQEGAFGSIDLRWYVSKNFYIQGGAFAEKERVYGRAGFEWQPGFMALPGLAFNVNGVFGEDDYRSIMGGLTYYFGAPVSLMDRHRRYDPESALFGLFQSVQQEQARLCAQYGAPTTPPAAPPAGGPTTC